MLALKGRVDALRGRTPAPRLVLLSDVSQSDGRDAAYPEGLHVMRLEEVIRSTQRIVAGASAFQLVDGGDPARCNEPPGFPLYPHIFACGESYAAKVVEAIEMRVVSRFEGLSLHNRLAIIVPDAGFREGMRQALADALSGSALLRNRNRNVVLKSAREASACVASAPRRDGEEWLVYDTVDAVDGLERLFVVAVGLDVEGSARPESGGVALEVRSRIYRAMTRAHMMVCIVNEAVRGGWLEFLRLVKLDRGRDYDAEEAGRMRGAAKPIVDSARDRPLTEAPSADTTREVEFAGGEAVGEVAEETKVREDLSAEARAVEEGGNREKEHVQGEKEQDHQVVEEDQQVFQEDQQVEEDQQVLQENQHVEEDQQVVEPGSALVHQRDEQVVEEDRQLVEQEKQQDEQQEQRYEQQQELSTIWDTDESAWGHLDSMAAFNPYLKREGEDEMDDKQEPESEKKGVDSPANQGVKGDLSLVSAAKEGRKEDVARLLEQGADVMERDADGATALMRASENGHVEVVKHLVERGGDAVIKATDEDGGTALMLASQNGHVEVVKHLVERGGDAVIKATDRSGMRALQFAKIAGHRHVVNFLQARQ